MTSLKRPPSSILAAFLAVCAIVASAPAAAAAAEYVPPKMDEASCDRGATLGRDITGSYSSDWYFIGAKPPCSSAGSLKKFCALLQTLQGYSFETAAQKLNDDPVWLTALVASIEDDEDTKAQILYSHPKQSLQKSLQKCGLNDAQVRAKFLAEAEAASKSDAGSRYDLDVIGTLAPDLAMTIWKRECEGHRFTDPSDHSEMTVDKYWKAHPRYLGFCTKSTEDPMAKRPKDFSKVWPDMSGFWEN